MKDKAKILRYLEEIAEFIPAPLYWFDRNNKVLGGNKAIVEGVGGASINNFIGKTPHAYYPEEMAEVIIKGNNKAMETGKAISQEEAIKDVSSGEVKYFTAIKAPLYDDDGKTVIGTIGTSIDITKSKEAERQKAQLKVVKQMSHDINAPISSMSMIMKVYEKDIPEQLRIALQSTISSIRGIVSHAVDKYEQGEEVDMGDIVDIMVPLVVIDILDAKFEEYRSTQIEFTSSLDRDLFAFIKMNAVLFKRIMSNIINNSVEAVGKGNKGTVNVRVGVEDGKYVKVVIGDDGCGMSSEIAKKLVDDAAAVVSTKGSGRGIGFKQVLNAVKASHGKLELYSELGIGTKVILTFPLVQIPNWIIKEVNFDKGDVIVVLDDDQSVHIAWDVHLARYKRKKDIQLKHFVLGEKAISFIKDFKEKNRIFLLADFELLGQEMNGVEIIKKTGVKRAILVTSHYCDSKVIGLARAAKIKLLPKQLAPHLKVTVSGSKINRQYWDILGEQEDRNTNKKSAEVKAVFVDDDKLLLNTTRMYVTKTLGVKADFYSEPENLLKKLSRYDKNKKNMKFFIDNSFASTMSGIELAGRLYKAGYKKLYLFTGGRYKAGELPKYLKLILKTDIDGLRDAVLGKS